MLILICTNYKESMKSCHLTLAKYSVNSVLKPNHNKIHSLTPYRTIKNVSRSIKDKPQIKLRCSRIRGYFTMNFSITIQGVIRYVCIHLIPYILNLYDIVLSINLNIKTCVTMCIRLIMIYCNNLQIKYRGKQYPCV